MILTLPWPPSVNVYWRMVTIKGSGRVLISKEGRDYRTAVIRIVTAARQNLLLTSRLSCRIIGSPPDNRRRDVDNWPKAILDSLQYAGVYEDDSQIDDLHIYRAPKCQGGQVIVKLRPSVRLYGKAPAQEAFSLRVASGAPM